MSVHWLEHQICKQKKRSIWQLLGSYEKHHFLGKNWCDYFLGNFWKKKMGNFLFRHLVTMSPRLFVFFKKNWPIPATFFFIFVFSIYLTENIQYKFLPMTGYEPRTSGVRSDRSTNWATTTFRIVCYLLLISNRPIMYSLEHLEATNFCYINVSLN